MPVFQYRSRFEVSADELFDWHMRPGALERLTPPWQPMRVIESQGGMT
jgi:ligand-binding SRPBCC domain-containing protein